MRDLILAIDAGTTSVKAAVFDGEATVVSAAEEETCVRSPRPGLREIDMHELAESTFRVLEAALAEVDRAAVVGVAVTAQGDGAWLLGDDAEPVGPAILWNDARSAEVFVAMRESGEIDRIKSVTKGSVHPGSLPVIARWLAVHEPDRLARVRHQINAKDWIRYVLTDRLETEASDACRSYFSAERNEWDEELFDELGDLTADTTVPLASAGETRPLAPGPASRLGLAPGIPVGIGAMDVASVGYAFSGDDTGRAWAIIGTTSFIGVVRDAVTDRGNWMAYGSPGSYLNSLAPMIGTPLLEWTRRVLGRTDEDWPAFERFARSGEALACSSPLTLPYLAPSGERAPFVEPYARGSIHGLTYDTSGADIALSVYVSIASTLAECMDVLQIEGPVSVAGGGSSSDLLCQLLADCSGRTVQRPTLSAEAGMLGAVRRLRSSLGTPMRETGTAPPRLFEPSDQLAEPSAVVERLRQARGHEQGTWSLLAAV